MKLPRGLGWNRWVDPIESFVHECGRLTPRWAIICTYECEMDRLEQDVLPLLVRRGRAFRTMVLVDAGTLQARLNEGKAPTGRINVHPVRLLGGGVFHSKLVLLRAGNRVRVCFGSSNLTSGGMGSNLELWAYSDEPEIVQAFTAFLDKLKRHESVALDPPSCRTLDRAMMALGRRNSPSVWTSLDESFSSRLRRRDSGLTKATAVHLVSPAYATKGGVKDALMPFRGHRTTIYTDGPLETGEAKVLRYDPPHPADTEVPSDEEDPSTPRPSKLHAKAYLFRTRSDAILWFGSANLTAQALVRPVRKRKSGNVELLVKTLLPGPRLRAFLADLHEWFPSEIAPGGDSTLPREPKASHRGFVLSGELQGCGAASRLIVHTLPGVRSVRLVLGRHNRLVAIKRGRGVIEGISRLLPELREGRNGDDWLGVIFELVRAERIPVIINVPLVAEPRMDGPATEDALNDWIDEFLGRWPPSAREKTKWKPRIPEDDDDDQKEDERRLDEADHQGTLDRLAVKAAIVKKRIATVPTAGGYRDAIEHAVGESLRKGLDPHIRPIVARWFDGKARERR